MNKNTGLPVLPKRNGSSIKIYLKKTYEVLRFQYGWCVVEVNTLVATGSGWVVCLLEVCCQTLKTH
jgi:hypothetical protein